MLWDQILHKLEEHTEFTSSPYWNQFAVQDSLDTANKFRLYPVNYLTKIADLLGLTSRIYLLTFLWIEPSR